MSINDEKFVCLGGKCLKRSRVIEVYMKLKKDGAGRWRVKLNAYEWGKNERAKGNNEFELGIVLDEVNTKEEANALVQEYTKRLNQ